MSGSLLAVFAHPDDESYRAGGTLALLAQAGARVQLLCATRGEWGIPKLPPHQARQVRKKELRNACQALGIPGPHFLDYEDGRLAVVPEGNAIARLVNIIREQRPDALLTWPPSGISGHSDHQTISHWTRKAFLQAANPGYRESDRPAHTASALYYLVVPHHIAEQGGLSNLDTVPLREVSLTIDVHPVWDQKMAAIRCHRSQIAHSPVMSFSPKKQAIFFGKEHFKRIYHHPLGKDVLDELETEKGKP